MSDSLSGQYAGKAAAYFAGVRLDIVECLQTGSESSIIEIGCGWGRTGEAVLKAGKAGHYVGVELNPAAAAAARERLPEVVEGDVEGLDLSAFASHFDALIISEVLEHLIDPWRVLRSAVSCLRPGGAVYASSPNIAHWKVIAGLVSGRFEYAEVGVMDRTHLRWFTPSSYRRMFESSGVEVVSLTPLTPNSALTRFIDAATLRRFSHLFATQIMLVGRRIS